MTTTKPSKSQPCPLTSALTIHLTDSDIIDYNKVDERGYIRPNKRGWIGLDVTVLLGHHETKGQTIFVPADTQKFLCQVLNNSYVSSISSEYAGQEVTLIVHK
jgi:hypothetical protein